MKNRKFADRILIFLIFILSTTRQSLLVLGAAQKCQSTDGADDNKPQIVCSEVEELLELSAELRASWTNIAVRNERVRSFALTAHSMRLLNHIEKLDLSHVGSLEISDHGFQEFNALQHLNISGVLLVTLLKRSYFQSSGSLEVLDASRNEIQLLTRDTLADLVKLRFANFSRNYLESVEGVLEALPNLEQLDLSGNVLKQLNFGDKSGLKYLNLRTNQIEVLAARTFVGLTALETLDISDGPLRKIEDHAFDGLAKLRMLNISDSALEAITPNSFDGLQRSNLHTLDLRMNGIKSLPANAFEHIPSLQVLDISTNKLTSLKVDTFHGLRSLRKIYASNSYISELEDGVFANLNALDTLDLSRNRLAKLDGGIFGINTLPKLRRLWLNTNNLSVLHPLSFSSLPFLEYLSLGNNKLTTLDVRMFAPLRYLQKLHLGNNLLEEFPSDVLNTLDNVLELLIDHNQLTFMPDVNVSFPRLMKVSLEGNPWQCPCLHNLEAWLNAKGVQYVRPNSPYFNGQKPLCVVTITDACVKDLQLVKLHYVADTYAFVVGPNEPEIE